MALRRSSAFISRRAFSIAATASGDGSFPGSFAFCSERSGDSSVKSLSRVFSSSISNPLSLTAFFSSTPSWAWMGRGSRRGRGAARATPSQASKRASSEAARRRAIGAISRHTIGDCPYGDEAVSGHTEFPRVRGGAGHLRGGVRLLRGGDAPQPAGGPAGEPGLPAPVAGRRRPGDAAEEPGARHRPPHRGAERGRPPRAGPPLPPLLPAADGAAPHPGPPARAGAPPAGARLGGGARPGPGGEDGAAGGALPRVRVGAGGGVRRGGAR